MDIYLVLSIFLVLSAATAFLLERLGFTRLAGYILTGVLIGLIFSEDVENNRKFLDFFCEVAITLVAFEIGREIGFERIRKLDLIPIAILSFEVFFALALAFLFGSLFKLRLAEIVFLAIIFSFSSTAILFKLMETLNFPEETKKQIFTVTVLEDVLAIVILAILPNFRFEELEFFDFLKFGVFFILITAVLITFGVTIFRKLFTKVVEPNELGVAIILGSTFFFATVSKFFGLSPALGAFSAGVALSTHPMNRELSEYLKPLREVFLIIFFVSLGVEAGLIESFSPILLIAPLIVFFRFLAFTSANWFVTGRGLEESIKIGFTASCVGEFGIVLTYEAMKIGLIGLEFLTLSILSVIFGALISSSMSRNSDKYSGKISSMIPAEIKIFVDKISVNIRRILEGKTSTVVSEIFFRIVRNVLVLIAVVVISSAVLYVSDLLFPDFSLVLFLFILLLIFVATIVVSMKTRKYSEELYELFFDQNKKMVLVKDLIVGLIFMLLLFLSFGLAIIVSSRFFVELTQRLYNLDTSSLVVLTILMFFVLVMLLTYKKLKWILFLITRNK